MNKCTLLICAFLVGLPAFAISEELEGDYLYKVTTVRAAAGAFATLLAWEERMAASDYYDKAGLEHPLIMRHSQGDQWDLMVITPMESWSTYHAPEATERRRKAAAEYAELIAEGQALFAFYEDHFAFGPPWSAMAAAYADNDFYHIEMFMAAPGKSAELFEQRRMENAYLAATGQVPNMIFRRAAGSDVDVFTIGFHPSFETFAAPAGVTDEEKDRAAQAAGFKNLADISFYLRSLISGHRDTFATKVD